MTGRLRRRRPCVPPISGVAVLRGISMGKSGGRCSPPRETTMGVKRADFPNTREEKTEKSDEKKRNER